MAPGAHPLPELTRCGVGKLVDLATRDKPSGFNWFSPECSRGRGERASACYSGVPYTLPSTDTRMEDA